MATAWKSSFKDSIYKPIYNKKTTPAKMNLDPEGKKKKKDEEEEINLGSHGLGCASPTALVAWPRLARPALPRLRDLRRDLGRVGCASWVTRAPGRATQVVRPGRARTISFSPSLIWLFLSLSFSYLVSVSLIWLSLSDLIRSGEVRLCLKLGRFLKFFWIINQV